eukprot:UC1_evm4s2046
MTHSALMLFCTILTPVLLVVLHFSCTTVAAASRRMTFRDGILYEPESPTTPVILRGVDFVFVVNRTGCGLSDDDRRLLPQLLPHTNVLRLVMDHFHDNHDVGMYGLDCHSEDAATGYLQPACLKQFDTVLQWAAQELGIWVIFTGRGSHNALDMPGLWSNTTLRAQYVASWSFLARRYASYDNILGYEVMSEPRNGDNVAVHALHVELCGAVWAVDARAACVVGAANFYNRGALNATILLPRDKPVLYAANLFEPNAFVTASNTSMPYPAHNVDCCAGTVGCFSPLTNYSTCLRECGCKGSFQTACCQAARPKKTIGKQWLVDNLANVRDFMSRYKVPVWIDQWGVHSGAASAFGETKANAMQVQYVRDALDIFDQLGLHWSYWIFRRPGVGPGWMCYGPDNPVGTYALLCQDAQGNSSPYRLAHDGGVVEALNTSMMMGKLGKRRREMTSKTMMRQGSLQDDTHVGAWQQRKPVRSASSAFSTLALPLPTPPLSHSFFPSHPPPLPPPPPPPPSSTTAPISSPTQQQCYSDSMVQFTPDPVVAWRGSPHGTAAFRQVYNPSWLVASPGTHGRSGLVLRTQDLNGCPQNNRTLCKCTGEYSPSILTFAELLNDDNTTTPGAPAPRFTPVTAYNSTIFGPYDASTDLGTEDPRIAYDESTGTYYMMYTCYGKTTGAKLCLASSRAPLDGQKAWTIYGPVFPGLSGGTKSGALYINNKNIKNKPRINKIRNYNEPRDTGYSSNKKKGEKTGSDTVTKNESIGCGRHNHNNGCSTGGGGVGGTTDATAATTADDVTAADDVAAAADMHHLYWGAGEIYVTQSHNLTSWPSPGTLFINDTLWGNENVEAGPPPMPLSDGNLVFFHNSWPASWKRVGSYQPSWAIINGSNLTQIIARAPKPMWDPSLTPWMTGDAPYYCNAPRVAFVEAAHPTGVENEFRLYFGGADTVTGSAIVRINRVSGVTCS